MRTALTDTPRGHDVGRWAAAPSRLLVKNQRRGSTRSRWACEGRKRRVAILPVGQEPGEWPPETTNWTVKAGLS